ncbi:MAG: LysM peptidoglycan-binding domain-containing protein [Cyanobacteria bacterium SZAS LIN-2]|nr:LysM peptidoglycan-binding domain-containing protein [Cyanobacteria bacterium SZAS LIN-3]MBS1996157.1 LysM peptidoglycan-binding domain-containing protein [Cyanobacteria bacterium SZAS LIN-2]MBS2008892.1 LysM peptidoglycan-binding domain-containing protein [Cyanobacteria bacterium SZAS TMP-1]
MTACTEHTVKPGDCLWNIAKQHLIESGIDKPSDKQIADETNRLAVLNKLDENGRNRDLIYPGEKINFS